MLFFVVAIALIAGSTAVPLKDVKEVNALIDTTVKEIQAHKKIAIPGFDNAEINGLEHLKRDGSCVRTGTTGAYLCHAVATEAVVAAEGETMKVTLRIAFEVVVDANNNLVSFKVDAVDVKPNDPAQDFFSFWSKVKSALGTIVKDIEKTAEEAVKAVVHQKVDSIVTEVVTGLLAG